MPRRIRLSRRRGWRLPQGATVVARPTRWGNPFPLTQFSREESIRRYEADLLAGRLRVTADDVRRELRGRDLACWCALDVACHADVLLRVANAAADADELAEPDGTGEPEGTVEPDGTGGVSRPERP